MPPKLHEDHDAQAAAKRTTRKKPAEVTFDHIATAGGPPPRGRWRPTRNWLRAERELVSHNSSRRPPPAGGPFGARRRRAPCYPSCFGGQGRRAARFPSSSASRGIRVDACQLTGGQFTARTETGPLLGNDLSTFPTIQPDPRARRLGGPARRFRFHAAHFADHDILTPVAIGGTGVANQSRCAEDEPQGSRCRGRHARSSTRTRSTSGTWRRPAIPRTRSRTVRSTSSGARRGLTSMTLERMKEIDVTKREAEAHEEHVPRSG